MFDINETTLVQITNLGDKPLHYKYGSRPYILPPGKIIGVPYYAACVWFGNPLAVDEGTSEERDRKFRTEEIDRLSTLYGLCGAPWNSSEPYIQSDFMDDRISFEYDKRDDGWFWHPNLPNVRVTTLEGDTLPVVVMDPEGETVTPAEASSKSEARATTAAIESLQQQLHSLRLQLARQNEGVVAVPDESRQGVTDAPEVLPEAQPSTVRGPTIDAPADKRGPGRPRKP
jgi:hypothetical protein